MRLPSSWLSSARGPAGSNRWITRGPPDGHSTASFLRQVQALRELYERPMLHGTAQEQK